MLDYLFESVDQPSPIQAQGYQRKLSTLSQAIQNFLNKDTFDRKDLETLKLFTRVVLADRFDFEWYASFYDSVPADKTVVEVSPTYATASEQNVKLYAEYLGRDTQVVFILRNPVDRWLSLGRFDLKVALQQDVNDETVPFLAEWLSKRWQKVGGYQEYVETWERQFPNVTFVFHDDLHESDGSGLKEVCSILEVPWTADLLQNLDVRVNSQSQNGFPSALRTWVASERRDELNWMAQRFGDKAEVWRVEAEQMTRGAGR